MHAESSTITATEHLPPISAKTVILEVLSAGTPTAEDSIAVSRLVRAASAFDIAENSVRVAIVRLRADGLLESPERGTYRLGPAAKAINEQIHGWRKVQDRAGVWDGSWVAACTGHLTRADRPALRKRTRALRLLGFREMKPGLYVRPNNLLGGVNHVRQRLSDLGLEHDAVVFRADHFTEAQIETARELWDVAKLECSYDDLRKLLANSLLRLAEMDTARSVREAFVLGREGIRMVVLDPLLPSDLVQTSKRDSLIDIVTTYCDRGLELWAEFLNEP